MKLTKNIRLIVLTIIILLLSSHSIIAATYTYDRLSRLATVTYNNGQVVSYSYDAAGNITQISRTVLAVSDKADLSEIQVDTEPLEGFQSDILDYIVQLPFETTEVPTVTATVYDVGKASALITPAEGLSGITTITVTAEDGITTKIYSVKFTLSEQLSSDARLSDLSIDGQIAAGFDPEIEIYNIELPFGSTEVPTVTAAVYDTGKASLVINPATELPGTTTVIVTEEDGITTKTYTVNFTVEDELSSDARLSDLKIDGETVQVFDPEIEVYSAILPFGTTEVPL